MSIYLILFKSLVFSIFLYDLKNIFILLFIFFEPKRTDIPEDSKIDNDLISFSFICPAVPKKVHIVLSESGVTKIKLVPVGRISFFF